MPFFFWSACAQSLPEGKSQMTGGLYSVISSSVGLFFGEIHFLVFEEKHASFYSAPAGQEQEGSLSSCLSSLGCSVVSKASGHSP